MVFTLHRGLSLSAVLAVTTIGLAACDNYPGYPHNEPSARDSDNYKSGNGYYGGVTGQDESHQTPGGPTSTAPLGGNSNGGLSVGSPTPGMADTGTSGNNSAAGSSAGMTPNNGTAPTQDGGSH